MVQNPVDLTSKKCVPCEGGMPALDSAKAGEMLRSVPEWRLDGGAKAVSREFVMKDFMSAVRLIGSIAALAEGEGHHPDLHLTGYRRLRVELSTHAAAGLTENDFILAAKIDRLPKELKK